MIARTASFQEKRDWLENPFGWAAKISLMGVLTVAMMWHNGESNAAIALAAIMLLGIDTGLLFWGLHRLSKATKQW